MTDAHWFILDRIGILCGLLAFFGTLYSAAMWARHHARERGLREPVTLRLVADDDRRELSVLPQRPIRRTLSRSEGLGLLGMIPSHQQRFDWRALLDPSFIHRIEEAHRGRRGMLDIPITAAEFSQLGLPVSAVPPSPAAG